jgi:hypothetical protein
MDHGAKETPLEEIDPVKAYSGRVRAGPAFSLAEIAEKGGKY